MDLVIGETSQISHYFPKDIVKISSRNIPNEIFEVSLVPNLYKIEVVIKIIKIININ